MLRGLFPVVGQLEGYDRTRFRSDLSAGLTVGVMLIPQGMAYALIAGMPPIYGLYASLVPLLVYAALGTSRQLSVGPVAIVSLLVAAGVEPLAGGDIQRHIELALLLALMVGTIQFAMGLLRFGFLTNFLSHPVLAGFTSAAAIIIGASQLRHLVGMDLPRSHHILEILLALGANLSEVHLPTLALGTVGIALLWALGRLRQTIPGALFLVVLATGAAYLFGLEEAGIAIVGAVPGGLPTPTIPGLELGAAWTLLPVALTIALVGFMESIAVAKVYATRHRYDVDPNRELAALGMANLVGAFFRAFPTTGGFSRTAVNDQAGANSTMASVMAAAVIGVTLLLLTGLFHHLPTAALAAVIMVAVARLVDWREARHLWRTDRRDFAMMLVTFGATLAVGIEAGIIVGVVASLVALIYESSRPHCAVLGRLPDTDTYRNLARYPEAQPISGVPVFRIDATLSFANAEFLKDRVRELANGRSALVLRSIGYPRPRSICDEGMPPRAIVFDFHAVNGADSTALHQLEELVHELRARGVAPYFAGVKGPVMDRFKKVGLDRDLGEDHFHLEVAKAVEAAVRDTEGAAVEATVRERGGAAVESGAG
jgi:sulfate permease, SulP family